MPPQLKRALHVAEKPSVAKSLASTLSKNQCSSRQGKSVYNRLYDFELEFNGPGPVLRGKWQHVVTSVTGHLLATEFEDPYNKWNSCAPRDLLRENMTRIKRFVPDDKQLLKQQLESEARKADALILWLDCDREGEAISFEVLEVCTAVKEGLDAYRAKFSSLDTKEISRAWISLGRPDKKKSDAVEARCELDLRAGAALTRFQTFRIQHKYPGVNATVSYGPCQFPTLGLIVERQLAIDNHIPRDFWTLDLVTTASRQTQESKDTEVAWTWRRRRLYEKLPTLVLYEMCLESIRSDSLEERPVITHLAASPSTKYRPIPLSTVELQKRAARWLKLSSSETMEIAESLYQRGFLSYPRTDTDVFKSSCDLRALITDQRNDPRWGKYAAALLDTTPESSPGAFKWPRSGTRDDEAHPPIHPTKIAGPNDLQDAREVKLYDLVTRHFLASCSHDAVGRQTTVLLKINSEIFEAKGLVIDHRNFLDVYPFESWRESSLPSFTQGDVLSPRHIKRFDLNHSATQPPRGLTESDLLALMDKHGIGTDATMAEHIKTILTREYASRDNNTSIFRPTKLGLALVDAYDRMGEQLNRPDLRAKMEADLSLIAAGTKQKDAFMKEALATLRRVFDVVYDDAAKLDDAMREHFLASPPTAHHQNQAPGATAPSTVQHFGALDSSGFVSRCGSCSSSMTLRLKSDNNKRYALHCQHCNETYVLPEFAEAFVRLGVNCYWCGFEAIEVKSTRPDGTPVTKNICPKCLRQPPKGSAHRGSDFTCNDCAASENCRLAKGVPATPICPCYNCHTSSMTLFRFPTSGSLCVKCDDCSAAIYLPKEAISATVLQDFACTRCDQTRGPVTCIRLRFPVSKIPAGLNPKPKICVLCDTSLEESMGLSLYRGSLSSSRPGHGSSSNSRGGRGYGRGTNGRSAGRGGRASSSSTASNTGGPPRLPPQPPRPLPLPR